MVGGCAVAAADGGPQSVARRAAASPASPTAWVRGDAAALHLGGGPSTTLTAVLAPGGTGGRWVVAGTRLAADGATVATVWTSPDAVHWTAATLPGADGRVLAATAWGARTVLVGSLRQGGLTRAAVWVAPGPGEPFAAVPADAAMLATAEPAPSGPAVTGSASMDVVAAGAQGVFAAGSVSGRQAMWYSTDGTAWVRLTGAERVIDTGGGVDVTSMLVTPDAVMAAGTVPDGTFTDGAVWSSSDGLSWHRSPDGGTPFAGAGDHRIDGLATESTGSIVAVGAERSGPSWMPASWVSPDGTQWSQPSLGLPSTPRPQPTSGGVVRAVTETPSGNGLVAVGGSATAQSVWTSTDGLDWTATPLPAGDADSSAWTADLVATDGATTVVVDDGPGQPRVLVRRAGRWLDESADPRTFGPAAAIATPAAFAEDAGRLLLAVDVDRPGAGIAQPATSTVAVLSSRDGTHWSLLDRGGVLLGARVDDLIRADGALVAVGTARARDGSPAAAMWTSTTGRRWHLSASFAGRSDASRQASTVAMLGPDAVAVGRAPLSAGSGVDAAAGAQGWSETIGGWTAQGALDGAVTPVDDEEPLGSCSDGHLLVVVGQGTRRGVPRIDGETPAVGSAPSTAPSAATVVATGSPAGPDGQGDDGTVALTWTSSDARAWTAGTVSPVSGAGGAETMQGCAAVGAGFVAWGQAPGHGGRAVPALWSSPDGIVWTLERTPSLGVAGSAPITALARAGRSWFAVTGGGLAAATDPTAATADPPGSAAPASGPDGPAGVWSSDDRGVTWVRLDTTGPAWATTGTLSTDLVATIGGASGATVVVAGSVDGALTTWTARPGGPTVP